MASQHDHSLSTNVFELALEEQFRKLGVGEPDESVRQAIEDAGRHVTLEVKRFMKEKQLAEAHLRSQSNDEQEKLEREFVANILG